jgi:hypothetical protein
MPAEGRHADLTTRSALSYPNCTSSCRNRSFSLLTLPTATRARSAQALPTPLLTVIPVEVSRVRKSPRAWHCKPVICSARSNTHLRPHLPAILLLRPSGTATRLCSNSLGRQSDRMTWSPRTFQAGCLSACHRQTLNRSSTGRRTQPHEEQAIYDALSRTSARTGTGSPPVPPSSPKDNRNAGTGPNDPVETLRTPQPHSIGPARQSHSCLRDRTL